MTTGKRYSDSRLSVRLTPEERVLLEQKAGGQRLSDYVRGELLGKARAARKNASTSPKTQELAQILGLLGQTDAFLALSNLHEAVRVGALPADEDLRSIIRLAQQDLAEIKSLLMTALRTKER